MAESALSSGVRAQEDVRNLQSAKSVTVSTQSNWDSKNLLFTAERI